MGELPCYMRKVPDYEVVDDEDMLITLDGFALIMPIPIFLAGCAKGKAAIERARAEIRQCADIVPFKRPAEH